ncbi:MAG TPA: ribonuclease H-like domain-containing protein [Clostridiaceae bacterium]|nr:ribonuclease H-like domain-containing protein [Clostridiaceae bacterium]
MYQDLKSKLEMYKKSLAMKKESVARQQEPVRSNFDIDKLLEGFICSNGEGSCFVTEERYPASYIYGGCSIGNTETLNTGILRNICGDIDNDMSLKDFLFLDTETTGLSGGTGTVAFLVGTGFFEKGEFVLRQFFMRDYDEEPAMLTALNELLSKYKGLITFNGKAFDWNLLHTRFVFNRIKPSMSEPVHLDLLFPARKIWKLKLESCSLVSIEEKVLEECRTDDVPGAMIPSIYFKYLEDRDARGIKRVIKHNKLDIMSMVSLLNRICSMLENPLAETDGDRELLGIGKIFESSGDYQNVIDCFEACMGAESIIVKESASKKLSQIYKRSKNYEKAVEHWNNMLKDPSIPKIFPMIELAKYYEHKKKDPFKALEIVEEAVRISAGMGIMNNIYHKDLKKRLERLRRKTGSVGNA